MIKVPDISVHCLAENFQDDIFDIRGVLSIDRCEAFETWFFSCKRFDQDFSYYEQQTLERFCEKLKEVLS